MQLTKEALAAVTSSQGLKSHLCQGQVCSPAAGDKEGGGQDWPSCRTLGVYAVVLLLGLS